MINSLSNSLPGIKSIPSVPGAINEEQKTNKADFGSMLSQALEGVNQLQKNSTSIQNDFLMGKIDDLHTVMIESEKADLALQFTLQVRNKLLDAYNEIMRMPL